MPVDQLGHVRHRHLRLHLELRQVDDREQRRVEGDLLARLHVALRDRACDRRAHDRIAHQDLRLLELRARGGDSGELRLVGAVGGVERILRDEVLLDELGVGLACALVGRQLRPGRLVARGALGELRAQLRGVELGNRLPGRDPIALAHQHAPDLGRQLGPHGGLRHRMHRARQRQLDGQPPRLQLHDIGRGELQRRRLLLLARGGLLGALVDRERRRTPDRGDGEHAHDGQPPLCLLRHFLVPRSRRRMWRARAHARGTDAQ
jgi:hypothetical protein